MSLNFSAYKLFNGYPVTLNKCCFDHSQTLMVNENIRIQEQFFLNFCTHMISSIMAPTFCKLDLAWLSYGFCQINEMKCIKLLY